VEDKIIQIGFEVLSVVMPFLAGIIFEFIRRKLGVEGIKKIQEELAAKQELVSLAVRFAQQAYQDLHGPEKYQKAVDWLVMQAERHGLAFTADEIKGMIEAAVRNFKDAFGEEWGKELNSTKLVTPDYSITEKEQSS